MSYSVEGRHRNILLRSDDGKQYDYHRPLANLHTFLLKFVFSLVRSILLVKDGTVGRTVRNLTRVCYNFKIPTKLNFWWSFLYMDCFVFEQLPETSKIFRRYLVAVFTNIEIRCNKTNLWLQYFNIYENYNRRCFSLMLIRW